MPRSNLRPGSSVVYSEIHAREYEPREAMLSRRDSRRCPRQGKTETVDECYPRVISNMTGITFHSPLKAGIESLDSGGRHESNRGEKYRTGSHGSY
jgi:hypothetical protein